MSAIELKSDLPGYSGSHEYHVDFPVAAVGDLPPDHNAEGFGIERYNRVEPRHFNQRAAAARAAATIGLRHARLPIVAS